MPPPPLDKSTTFTEAQMQELKRRPSKSMGSRNEIEQCKEMYRILFPSASLPDSLYVSGDGPGPRRELQAELATTLEELLLTKVPEEAKYAQLDAMVKAIIETAQTTGFIDEAAKLVTHKQKRRRISEDRPYIVCDEPGAEKRPALSQSSDKLPSRALDEFTTNSWSIWPLGAPNTTPSSPLDPNALGQTDYGPYVGTMDHFLLELHSVDPELTAQHCDGQTEAIDMNAQNQS